MKSILGPGMIVGLFLLCGLSATGQTQGAALRGSSALPTSVHNALENTTSRYDYDFISKDYVWSNKPLKSTAGKVCQTMKEHAFSETPYGINAATRTGTTALTRRSAVLATCAGCGTAALSPTKKTVRTLRSI